MVIHEGDTAPAVSVERDLSGGVEVRERISGDLYVDWHCARVVDARHGKLGLPTLPKGSYQFEWEIRQDGRIEIVPADEPLPVHVVDRLTSVH